MFARAIGDLNPLFTDPTAGGVIAPPTFVQAGAQFDPGYMLRPKDGQPWFGSSSVPSGTARQADSSEGGSGADSGSGVASGLHAEQRFEYHGVVRAGDVLSATARPGKTWEKQGRRGGTLQFTEFVTEYRNQRGELVVTATAVGVRTERVPDQAET